MHIWKSRPSMKCLKCLVARYTAGRIEENTVVAETLEDLPQVLLVLFLGGASDEYIININGTKVQPSEDLVHEPPEGLACTA